jgi:hypothetical protein
MIRGAGRLTRMDERAAFSTPGGDAVRDGRHLMAQDGDEFTFFFCPFCSRFIKAGEQHGLVKDDGFGCTVRMEVQQPARLYVLDGIGDLPVAGRVIAEEHDGEIGLV